MSSRENQKRWADKNRSRIRETARRRREDPREREKDNAVSSKSRRKNRGAVKCARLRKDYGITLAHFFRLLDAQSGLCAICGATSPGRALDVDHDHGTGIVRGLLCVPCNRGIGIFSDDPGRLRAAAGYLEKKREGNPPMSDDDHIDPNSYMQPVGYCDACASTACACSFGLFQ
jgi:hypothetical protein